MLVLPSRTRRNPDLHRPPFFQLDGSVDLLGLVPGRRRTGCVYERRTRGILLEAAIQRIRPGDVRDRPIPYECVGLGFPFPARQGALFFLPTGCLSPSFGREWHGV